MYRTGTIFIVAALLMSAGCNRETKQSDPSAALENAYKSGLLTKEEYEAKKLAMAGKTLESLPAPAPAAEPTPAQPVETKPEVKTAVTRPAVAKPEPKPRQAAAQKQAGPFEQAVANPNSTPAASALPAPPPPVEPPPAAAPPPPPAPAEKPAPSVAKAVAPAKTHGCDDADAKPDSDNDTKERTFAASQETVRRAALEAFAALDFQIQKNTSAVLDAKKKRHLGAIVGAGGEHVVLSMEKSGQGTKVTAKTVKSIAGRLAQKNWTNAVLAQLACRLSR